MIARPYLLKSTLSLSAFAVLLFAMPLFAQVEQTTPEVDNSKFSSTGLVNSNSVFVRSGPGESYYATMKLDKGAKLTVVGMHFDWLKIQPPEGSFCYVAKSYVDRKGDADGRITKDAVNCRAGSSLNEMKVVTLCQLAQGTEVQILGEHEEYFKIKPPDKAYLFVAKQFVDPDPASMPVVQHAEQPVVNNPPAGNHGGSGVGVIPSPTHVDRPISRHGGAVVTPATNPSDTEMEVVTPAPAPAAAEAVVAADNFFEKTENDFTAATAKPLDQQPIDELIKAYQSLVDDEALAPTLRRIAQSRLATLKGRADAAGQLAAVRKNQQDLKQKQLALQAERKELEQRLANSAIRYAALGTLQPSSLQVGQGTLYRLTDPANGRTIVYLRSTDAKMNSFLGSFVGIRGDIVTDDKANLRYITPTDIVLVDPTKLNGTISAELMPTSLQPKDQTKTD